MNKLCDAADWFTPGFDAVIRNELAQLPQFRRKQWEFGAIYQQLQKLGLLHDKSSGISFGSGTEVVLYAVARRVGHLWATDLYNDSTTWKGARTGNAETHVLARAPGPTIPEGRLSAKSMDMRDVTFPDESFDFAYSSCVLEHIGKREDFIRHLREVRRVLKPGGSYIFTTEFNYTDLTVENIGLHFFARQYLENLVAESGLSTAANFNCSLARHTANTPLPNIFAPIINPSASAGLSHLFDQMLRTQLLWANMPFTSCIITLKKGGEPFAGWNFMHWTQTKEFIDDRVSAVRSMIEDTDLTLQPFAGLPDGKSTQYIEHEEFFQARPERRQTRGPIFHSPFVWLGRKPRQARVDLIFARPLAPSEHVEISIKKHTLAPRSTEIIERRQVSGQPQRATERFDVAPDDNCSYAIFCRGEWDERLLREVSCSFRAACGV